MFKKKIYFLLITVLFSCTSKTQFNDVIINDRYSISLADYLSPCSDLHSDASLQYQNIEKEIYALVIDEKKSKMQHYDLSYTVDSYFKNIASQPFLENIKDAKISGPTKLKIGENKAIRAMITGKIDKTEVVYQLSVIETPFTFYQLLIWTKAERFEKLENDIERMILSFRELKLHESIVPESTLSESVTISTPY